MEEFVALFAVALFVVVLLCIFYVKFGSAHVEVVAATTAAGHIEVLPKAKYIELKKISHPTMGVFDYAGVLNIGKIYIYPEGSYNPIPTAQMTATASSELGSATLPSNMIDYSSGAPANIMWHSKLTPNLGEWARIELKTPTVVKKIVIYNRPGIAYPSTRVESTRIIGTQVTILDADRNPIKTYVIANNAASFEFAGH